MMANQTELNFQVIIESDEAEKDFMAYIPALRLGARGETSEEAVANAKDLLMINLESRVRNGQEMPKHKDATMEMIKVSVPVLN